MLRKTLLLCVSFFVAGMMSAPGILSAAEVQAAWAPKSAPVAVAAPERLVEKSGTAPAFLLAASDESMVRPVADWNLAGNVPLRNGIERPLPQVVSVVLSKKASGTKLERFGGGVLARSADDSTTVWGIAIRVEQAWRMRLRLGDVRLPKDARMWVYNENGETVGPFGTELMGPDGTLWTPSVGGPEIRLEISIPDSAWENEDAPSLRVEAVSELFPLDQWGLPQLGGELQLKDTSCLIDATCVTTADWPIIDLVTKAVAHLQFQVGGNSYICTGSLVNDSNPSTWVPYLLTANHCFSTQSAASTLEAFFDYIDSTCGGSAPPLATLPRTNGSTLLETRSVNDFTFVRLNQSPSGNRVFLGWTTAEPADGESLARVSHPNALPAMFSVSAKVTSPLFTCGWSTTNFHFEDFVIGGVAHGSSGAALLNDTGQIMGQLMGACSLTDPEDACDYLNYQVDGKFSVTYPYIAQYLGFPGGGSDCVNTDTILCLRSGNRFQVEVEWHGNGETQFNPAYVSNLRTADSGLFYYNNPNNLEFLIKVLNACGFNDRYWVFFAATTDVAFNVTVTDTETGASRFYTNPLGHPADAVTDKQAFATCP